MSSDDSLRAEAGSRSMDDMTIFSTPVPMVASTVSRPVGSTIRRVGVPQGVPVVASHSRSSMGILSLDNMPELCSSMLHYEGKESETLCTLEASLSPRAKSTRQQSHMQTAPWSTRESYGTVMHVTPMPQSHGVSGQTLTSHSDLLLEADPVTMRQRRDLSQWDDPYGQEQVLPPVVNVGGGRYMEPGIGTVGMNGALFRALGQSEGEDDADVSVHEVRLDDDELTRFDEEFSDFDVTVTNNDDDHQLSPRADGFTNYPSHLAFDLGASYLGDMGQRSAAVGQGSDGGDRGRHTQGEGQNLDDAEQAPDVPDRLDSRYFQQNLLLLHDGGDGEEEGEECSWRSPAGQDSSIFDNGAGDMSSRSVDTDEEIDALRREMECYVDSDNDDSDAGSRPDLEGTNTEENYLSVRQAGEGDVTSSPVPGDGGGGGDGSSGHGSDDNLLLSSSLSPPPMLPPGEPVDTSDMVRGLGYLLGGLSDERMLMDAVDDHPEARERLQPMGGDILSETSNPRQVTFSNVTDIRNRTLSGTSVEYDDDAPTHHQGDQNETDQHLTSLFLKATPQSASDSTHWDMEQSTFNLVDLCSPSGHDAGLAVTPCHASMDQSDWQSCAAGMSCDSLSRSTEGRQSEGVQEPGESLWVEAGGNWLDAEDVWNLSRNMGSDRQLTTDVIDAEENTVGSDAGFSDEFMTAEHGLAMLEEDQEMFIQEQIVAEEQADRLPPGWSFHNESMISRPSWLTSQEDTSVPDRRVSIGTFMASRTDALGGISGDVSADSRPTFGSKAVSPPGGHQPRPLLPPSDLSETGDGSSCVANDDVRGSGVGSDVGDVEDNCALCIEDLCGAGPQYDLQAQNRQAAILAKVQGYISTSPCFHGDHAGSGDVGHQETSASKFTEQERDSELCYNQEAGDGRTRQTTDSVSMNHGNTDNFSNDSKAAADDSCVNEHETRTGEIASDRHDPTDGRQAIVDNSTYKVAAPTRVDDVTGDSSIDQVKADSVPASFSSGNEFDESSFLHVSTISKLITSSSANAKADDLIGLILRASTAKRESKKPKSAKDGSRKTTAAVHSASLDSVHPRRIDGDSQSRDQRLTHRRDQQVSHQVQKTCFSERSRSATDAVSPPGEEGGNQDGTAQEQADASGLRRRSNVTRLPTYQRPTVASAGRREARKSRDGPDRGAQTKQGRRQSDRVGGSSSSGETTPRGESGMPEEHVAYRREFSPSRMDFRSGVSLPDDGSLTGSATGVERVKATTINPSRVRQRQGVQSVRGSQSLDNVVRMHTVDDEEMVNFPDTEAAGMSSEWLLDNSESVNTDGARLGRAHYEQSERFTQVEVDGVTMVSRVSGVNSERSMRTPHSVTPPERVSANSGVMLDRHRNHRRLSEAVRSRSLTDQETEHDAGVESLERLSQTDIGRHSSLSDAAMTDWNSPRPSLAMSRSQRQDTAMYTETADRANGDVPADSVAYNRVRQNGTTTPPKTRSKRASGEPVESFHHSLLPSDQQRASLVLPPDGGVNRPALLTGHALSSLPFATQYLDDITTGLRDVYSNSSVSGTESESNDMSTLAMIDEFTSLPMSRPSVASLHEYDTRESFSPDVETMFATRTALPPRDGRTSDLSGVTAPREAHLPGVCCVGLSSHCFLPVHNPTTHWLHVSFIPDALSIEGQGWQVAPLTLPFMIKDKVIVEPLSTEEVKVIFVPRQPGRYALQLRLVVNPIVSDASVRLDCLPSVVTIQAVAEDPQIQVVTESSQCAVDFGALPWGCQKCRSVTLVNRGRANVPVRLIISSNKSTWSCFTFGKSGTADVSTISNQSLPSIQALAPSVANCMLYGSSSMDNGGQAITVPVFFQAPARKADRYVRMTPPVEFSAGIDVGVNTPTAPRTLGSIMLRATVGTARLHVPTDMNIVRLRSEVGATGPTQFIPLHNAGNIPLDVSIEVTEWPDLFVVMPMRLTIQPSDQSRVMIRFEPKENVSPSFESLLLMFVEPDGPAYEITLRCDVLHMPRTVTPARHTPYIYSNKHHLDWGGVAIGKAAEQSTTLKNKANQPIKLTLLIRCGDCATHDFQLRSSSRGRQTVGKMELILSPEEEYTVRVLFAPSTVRECRTTLQVRQFQPAYKYTIPLSGYGGVSRIIVDDLQLSQKDHYWTNVGPVIADQRVIAKVTVHNVGARAAYISAMSFQDLGCKRPLTSCRMSIQPNHFCLKPRQTQDVAVFWSASERQASLCRVQTSMVAAVAFFYGDEIGRRQLRRLARKLDETEMTRYGVNFNLPHQNEASVDEDSHMEMKSPKLFYAAMHKVMVALIGDSLPSPPPKPLAGLSARTPSHRGPMELIFNDDLSRMTNPAFATPQLDRVSHRDNNKPSSVRRKLTVDKTTVTWQDTTLDDDTTLNDDASVSGQRRKWWTIRPERIVLLAPRKHEEPVIVKVLLANYSDRALCYEFSWPAHYITLTHEQGIIEPRSTVPLIVSANRSVRSKGVQLPWRGLIHITCDGQRQELQVQIKDQLTSNDTSQNDDTTLDPILPEPGTPLLVVTPPSPTSRRGRVSVSTQHLMFPETMVGKTTELPLELSNRNAHPIRWTLTSVAPPYRKSANRRDVHRVVYSAFWLPKQTGLLHPQQHAQVYVDFCPRESGVYSQYWEVKAETQAAPSVILTTCKVEMTGQGCVDPSDPVSHPEDGMGALKGTSRLHGRGKALTIETKKSRVTFQEVAPNNAVVEKLEIKNKCAECMTVEIVSPTAPFSVSRSSVTIKSGHYVRLPITFLTDTPGHYQGVLMLKPEMGEVQLVHLIGRCT